jgi:hypothetical protein
MPHPAHPDIVKRLKRADGHLHMIIAMIYRLISRREFTSDESVKFVERLLKNRNKMFTFLDFDGVPWNNNNAEHAVKAFVTLRRVIDGVTSEEGLRDYLVLLSLCETCKYKSIDFLDFLRPVRRTSMILRLGPGKSQVPPSEMKMQCRTAT